MKSLSLPRPMILMVIGVPGSGKSFFARKFSTTFRAPLVSDDEVRSTIFQNPTYTRSEDTVISALQLTSLGELVKTQKTMIIDGGINTRSERFAIKKIAREHGYDTLTIWVQTDEPTCRTRAMKRSSKRAEDSYNLSLTEEQFSSLSKKLSPPIASEPFIVISGKHTYATQAKTILKKLIAPRQEIVEKPGAYSSSAYDQPIVQPPNTRRRNVIIN